MTWRLPRIRLEISGSPLLLIQSTIGKPPIVVRPHVVGVNVNRHGEVGNGQLTLAVIVVSKPSAIECLGVFRVNASSLAVVINGVLMVALIVVGESSIMVVGYEVVRGEKEPIKGPKDVVVLSLRKDRRMRVWFTRPGGAKGVWAQWGWAARGSRVEHGGLSAPRY